MPYEIPGDPQFTLPAAVDLRTQQFRLVTVDATGLANIPAVGTAVIGVCQNKPNVGEAVTIVGGGIFQVIAGAAIAAGAAVQCDATGAVITKAAGINVGRSLEAAAGAGVRVAVLFQPAPA